VRIAFIGVNAYPINSLRLAFDPSSFKPIKPLVGSLKESNPRT